MFQGYLAQNDFMLEIPSYMATFIDDTTVEFDKTAICIQAVIMAKILYKQPREIKAWQ